MAEFLGRSDGIGFQVHFYFQLFETAHVLAYALAADRARRKRSVVAVEGYMDVVALAQFGIRNAVATLGTATTADHLRRLFRLVSEVVFCFDGDKAGRQAAARALETVLPAALRLYHAELLDLPTLFRAMSLNPATRLGLASGRLSAGAPADLVLFDPDAPLVLDRFKLQSKSKNTPFDTQQMQGRVLATYVAGEPVYRKEA